MSYTLVNGLAILVGIIFIWTGYKLVRHGGEDLVLFVVLSLVGVGLITVGLYPGIFAAVADVLGLEWKARAILVVSNLTLFVIAAVLFSRIQQLNRRLTRLNEEVSLLRTNCQETDE
jgi:hypothetical protein